MPRNKSCTCMVTEHLLVKMTTSSQQSAFAENEIVKFRGRVCLIVKIDRQLGFNRISVMDVNMGHQMAAFGYELERCEEVAAALLPDFEMMAGAGAARKWTMKRLMGSRRTAHTATQTKWAVGVFRGKILTLILECLGWWGRLFCCRKPGFYRQQTFWAHRTGRASF